jgi:bacteriocin biosynthesis cyclodehydratase domain-containing protein
MTGAEKNCLIVHPSVEVIELDDDQLQFYCQRQSFTVRDSKGAVRRLLTFADGRKTTNEIVALMPEAEELIRFLQSRGCLSDQVRARTSPLLYYLDALHGNLDPQDAPRGEHAARALRVSLLGVGAFADAMRQTLEELGYDVRGAQDANASEADIIVGVSDFIDHDRFRAWNRSAIDAERPIVFGAIDRHQIHLGPIVIPGETACFECCHHRLRSNVLFRPEFEARVARRGFSYMRGARPWLEARMASAFLAVLVSGFAIPNGVVGRLNEVVEIDLFVPSFESHPLLKLPRCLVCGPSRADRVQQAVYQPGYAPQ